jgi:hypothetical protein
VQPSPETKLFASFRVTKIPNDVFRVNSATHQSGVLFIAWEYAIKYYETTVIVQRNLYGLLFKMLLSGYDIWEVRIMYTQQKKYADGRKNYAACSNEVYGDG